MRDSLAFSKGTAVKALILLLAYPLAEIAGFVLVGGWIGVLPTLGLVILSGLLGALVRGSLQGIRGPVDSLADGALVVLGAMLLIVPGFLSDLVAIPLLIPPLRRALVAAVSARVASRRPASRHASADATIIDGTFYEVDPDEAPKVPRDVPSGWTRN
jgi:UPF0716 protein FxsA